MKLFHDAMQAYFGELVKAIAPPSSHPTKKLEPLAQGCTCDIKDLMSTGHVAGCPEKKP